MELYADLPLAPLSRSIRVLSLAEFPNSATQSTNDGHQQQAIHCMMSVIPLSLRSAGEEPAFNCSDSDTSSEFDALSYVWGDPSVKTGSMVCNGFPLGITPNLHTALSQIWKTWPKKRLWVDAVCINQADIPERNAQVTMMGDIYRVASCVVVWLGDATEKSERMFDLLEIDDLSAQKEVEVESWNRTETEASTIIRDNIDVGTLAREILARPWFERAWTLQEIQLASRATMCCGARHANFSRFVEVVEKYNAQQVQESYCGGDYLKIPVLAPTTKETDDETLFYQLAETSGRVASDPRDKLYCLLSLLPKELYDFMEADYALTVEETMIWTSRICVELDEETGFLADAGLENQKNDDSTLPSWVVDWRIPHDYDHHRRKNKHLADLRADIELLRQRREQGKALERTCRRLHLRGGGLGRIEIDDENPRSIHLAVFPECAIRWLGAPPGLKTPTWVELPDAAFVGFCRMVQNHDGEKCDCLDGLKRVEYSWRNLPRGAKSGDWLWQRADTEKNFDFLVRMVTTGDEKQLPIWKLVGEAWGQGVRGPFTRLRVALRHPEIKAVVANFAFE